MSREIRSPGRGVARLARVGLVGLLLLLVSSCGSDEKYHWTNLGVPERSATKEAPLMWNLWAWSWVAAMAVGVIVWGLIIYVAIRYRRRSDADIPVQTRYHLPLEVFYIVAPTVMCVVFFKWTLDVQTPILEPEEPPSQEITVVGQKWSWTFNHELPSGGYVYEWGTIGDAPTLVLPINEPVKFNLTSPDVIHSFWIPAFMMKMDIIPGLDNSFQVTPTQLGTFDGKCAELCGLYHSRMLFKVKVVTAEEYAAYLAELEERGDVSEEPVIGGSLVTTVLGTEDEEASE